MKRKDIEKAAGETAERIANIAYAGGGHIGQDDLEEAFIIGSNWRINSVWHYASEHPNANTLIICATENGDYFLYGMSQYYYEETVMDRAVTKWAYIEDLIPNMDE